MGGFGKRKTGSEKQSGVGGQARKQTYVRTQGRGEATQVMGGCKGMEVVEHARAPERFRRTVTGQRGAKRKGGIINRPSRLLEPGPKTKGQGRQAGWERLEMMGPCAKRTRGHNRV